MQPVIKILNEVNGAVCLAIGVAKDPPPFDGFSSVGRNSIEVHPSYWQQSKIIHRLPNLRHGALPIMVIQTEPFHRFVVPLERGFVFFVMGEIGFIPVMPCHCHSLSHLLFRSQVKFGGNAAAITADWKAIEAATINGEFVSGVSLQIKTYSAVSHRQVSIGKWFSVTHSRLLPLAGIVLGIDASLKNQVTVMIHKLISIGEV